MVSDEPENGGAALGREVLVEVVVDEADSGAAVLWAGYEIDFELGCFIWGNGRCERAECDSEGSPMKVGLTFDIGDLLVGLGVEEDREQEQ